jgi:hypothetical protein
VKLSRLLDQDVVVREELALELCYLSSSHLDRFQSLSDLPNIEECIPNIQKMVQATGDGHPYMASYLSNFAVSQGACFDCLRELTDLEHSLSNLCRAVQLTNDGHPHKPVYLCNLAVRLKVRFKHLD